MDTTIISPTNVQNNFVFLDAKKRFFFALKFGFLLLPLYFILILNRVYSGLFIKADSLVSAIEKTFFIVLILSFLIVLAIFISSRKLSVKNFKKIFYLLPTYYLILLSPLLLFVVGNIGKGGSAEAEAFSFIFRFMYTCYVLASVIPILFLSLLIYFWLKNRRAFFSIFLSILLLVPLVFIWLFIFPKIQVISCDYDDAHCFAVKAAEQNNPELCKVATSDEVAMCLGEVAFQTDEPALCNEARGYLYPCYSLLAIKQENPDVCENILDNYTKDSCYTDIYYTLGQNDASYCDKGVAIEDEKEKEEYTSKRGFLNYDFAVCYAIAATKNNNISLCDNLLGNNKRQCYLEYAIYKKDCLLFPESQTFHSVSSHYSNVYHSDYSRNICNEYIKTGKSGIEEKTREINQIKENTLFNNRYIQHRNYRF